MFVVRKRVGYEYGGGDTPDPYRDWNGGPREFVVVELFHDSQE